MSSAPRRTSAAGVQTSVTPAATTSAVRGHPAADVLGEEGGGEQHGGHELEVEEQRRGRRRRMRQSRGQEHRADAPARDHGQRQPGASASQARRSRGWRATAGATARAAPRYSRPARVNAPASSARREAAGADAPNRAAATATTRCRAGSPLDGATASRRAKGSRRLPAVEVGQRPLLTLVHLAQAVGESSVDGPRAPDRAGTSCRRRRDRPPRPAFTAPSVMAALSAAPRSPGVERFVGPFDGPVEGVGVDLAPEVGTRRRRR